MWQHLCRRLYTTKVGNRHHRLPQSATVRTLRLPLMLLFLTAEAFLVVYYQIFGSTSTLPSKRAFDPHDNTKGRVLARTIPPARTAATVKRYIARLEGFDPSQVDAIYPDAQSNRPIPDDAPIAALEGCPGTTVWSPLAISVREPRNESPTSSPSPMMLPAMSLVLSPSSFLEMDSPPPSPRISPLPEIPSSTEAQIRPLNQLTSPISPTSPKSSISPLSPSTYDSPKSPGQATFVYPPTSDPRWTIGKDGFAEPTESLTEAFKVVSYDQPPGWLRGIVQCIGFGVCFDNIPPFHTDSGL